MNQPVIPFRVHFEAGETIDVTAASAEAARKLALDRRGLGIITKVKIVREKDDG